MDSDSSTSQTALNTLNNLPDDSFHEIATAICAPPSYIHHLLQKRPFPTINALHQESTQAIMHTLSEPDLLQAINAHPRIGGASNAGQSKRSEGWSKGEQSGVSGMQVTLKDELAQLNDEYFEKYGFVFLICATGKSGEEMLDCLKERLGNERAREMEIARGEMAKIAVIRWDKALREMGTGE